MGYGVVQSDYIYDDKCTHFHHIRRVKWLKKGNWTDTQVWAMNTLSNITPYLDDVSHLKTLMGFGLDDEKESLSINRRDWWRDWDRHSITPSFVNNTFQNS